MNFPVASRSLDLARIKLTSLLRTRYATLEASGSSATVFDLFTTRNSSRLWILFANCEPVHTIIAHAEGKKEKKKEMEGDLRMILGTYRLVWMSIETGVWTRGYSRDLRFEIFFMRGTDEGYVHYLQSGENKP